MFNPHDVYKSTIMKFITNDKFLSLIFGGILFVFFAFVYPYHLNYQEQFRLFLFTGDYFLDFFSHPGGMADYLGNFITQFYFYSWVGALIISGLLVLLQRMVFALTKQADVQSMYFPLTYFPSILYWALLCDENYLAGGLVSLLIVVIFMVTFSQFRAFRWRMIFVLTSMPLLYWMCGGAFVMLPVFAIVKEWTKGEITRSRLVAFAGSVLLFAVALPLLAKHLPLQYPLSHLMIGTTYYRFTSFLPLTVGAICLIILISPFLLKLLSDKIRVKRPVWGSILLLMVVSLGGFMLVGTSADMKKEEVMAYDFNVRMRRWDKVIAMADKKTPMSPMSVSCLNLALAKENLLGERMFDYFQNGPQGLMPDFKRDFTVPMVAGEVYYHLGMVNTAQRYTFEAMEALPDYQKSTRAIKRLAETNIINGHYSVATKYLHLLQKTFYYRTWATKALETIKDESLIDNHSEWGLLRKLRPNEDFLFSEVEKDMMLGVVFQQNPENRMAFEYLLALCLLNKDLQHFWEYFPLGKSFYPQRIPLHFQEALVYVWGLQNNDPTANIPFLIGNDVKQRVLDYGRIYNSQSNAEALLKKNFSDTYWYYLQFRK